jgi:hypothetical protein
MRFRKYRAVSLTTMAQVLIRKLILGLFQGGKKWVRSSAEASIIGVSLVGDLWVSEIIQRFHVSVQASIPRLMPPTFPTV